MIFVRPFFNFWYSNSSNIELIIKAGKVKIIEDSFYSMFQTHLSEIKNPAKTILRQVKYFIKMKIGIAVTLLIEWINNGKDVSPDDLADMVINQMRFSLNFELVDKKDISN
jgi:hypothetical protein